jgi:hypothetical protein
MMRVGSELQKRAAVCDLAPSAASSSALPEAEEIAFPMLPGLAPVAQAARRDWDAVQDRQNQKATYTLDGLGRRALKAPGVEPVQAFICALAMTARQLTGRHAPITQFFTMSRYRCSDMVTGVVTTPEVERFVDAMIAGAGSHAERRELLVRAVASQQEAARVVRRSLPLQILMSLYVREQSGFRKRFALFSQQGMGLLLKAMGRMKPAQREILVSHPEIFPEVPVVGRPGIRLPYVTCFGLHYQIWEDATVITMMPGATWQTPNDELIARLTSNFRAVQQLL